MAPPSSPCRHRRPHPARRAGRTGLSRRRTARLPWHGGRGRPGRAARPVTRNVGACPPRRGGRTFRWSAVRRNGAGGGGCGAAGRARRRRGRGIAASPTAKPAAAGPSRSGSREPRRPAGGGLGTDSASRPSSRQPVRKSCPPAPPPASAEPVSPLGRIGRCGVFFRTAELGEVGCLTRVDVSPTVGIAEGAGDGTPGYPSPPASSPSRLRARRARRPRPAPTSGWVDPLAIRQDVPGRRERIASRGPRSPAARESTARGRSLRAPQVRGRGVGFPALVEWPQMVDWQVFATVAAPILTLFLGVWVNRRWVRLFFVEDFFACS